MRCPICGSSMASNAKRCPPCAARRKLVRDRRSAADKRACIPAAGVNLRETRRQRCPGHARERVNAERKERQATDRQAAEIAAEETITDLEPWDEMVRQAWDS